MSGEMQKISSDYFYLSTSMTDLPIFDGASATIRGAFIILASWGRITRATVRDLSKAWGVHERHAARMVQRMEKHGLIRTAGSGSCRLICIESDLVRTCGFHVCDGAVFPSKKGGGKWRGYGLPEKTRKAVLERDNYTCRYCGESGDDMHVDHVNPVSRGGMDNPGNLVCACAPCNLSKGAKTLKEWGGRAK